MIFQHPLGVTPSFELSIGGVAVDYTAIDRIEVYMNESEHDMVVLRIRGIPAKAVTDYIQAPVRLELRRGTAERQVFTGEVVEVAPKNLARMGAVNNSPFQVADIVCLGSSIKMRGVKSRVWGERTLTDIATEIADTYRFSIDVPHTTLLHTDTAQINKSDWSFLNELCDTYGFCVSAHGTHLHIWDPYKATGRQISYHILKSVKVTGGDPTPQIGAVLSFNGTFSSRPAVSRYTDVLDLQGNISSVYSNDLETNDNDSGLGKNYRTSYATRLKSSAKSIAEAELNVKAGMRSAVPFSATVEVFGLMEVYPGGLVRIEGFDSFFDSLWYVLNVQQVLSGNGFVTTLDIVNDSTNEESPTLYNTQRYSQPPEPMFKNGEWVATTRTINVYN